MTARTYTLLGPHRQPYQSATSGALGGYRPGRVYGRLDCPAALRAIARGGYVRNRVFFADEQTAVAARYRPCAVCLPDEHAQWKAGGLSEVGAADALVRLPTWRECRKGAGYPDGVVATSSSNDRKRRRGALVERARSSARLRTVPRRGGCFPRTTPASSWPIVASTTPARG